MSTAAAKLPTRTEAGSDAGSESGEAALSSFLNLLEQDYPHEMIRVSRPVDPARYEVSAVLKHLENRGKFPLVCFEEPKDVEGRPCPHTLLSNVFASRDKRRSEE